MKLIIILILLAVLFPLSADDLVLNYNITITNIKIIDEDDYKIRIEKSDGTKEWYRRNLIRKINKRPFNPDAPSEHISGEVEYTEDFKIKRAPEIKFKNTFPNLKLWAVTALSFAVAYDMFSTAANYQDDIDDYKKLNIGVDTSKLESRRNEKKTLGYVCAIVGLANTIYMVLPVKVSARGDMVNISYNF